MTDVSIRLDPATLEFDAFFDGEDLATDGGLYAALCVSLFTDREALPDDVIPDGTDNRRGCWSDAFASRPGDKVGSRRWLLSRSKLTEETLRRLRDYDLEALAWLTQDGVAKAVDIVVTRRDPHTADELITITRPDGSTHKYDFVWSSL